MKFANSAEAFGYYKDMPTDIIEARAQAIRAEVSANPECDLDALKSEIDALKSIKESRSASPKTEARSDLRIVERRSDDEDVFSTKEYRSAFFARAMGRELTTEQSAIMTSPEVMRRADGFNSSSNSAAVLPTTTLNEVIKRAKDKGGIISVARSFAMPTGITIPVAGPGARASWHVEGADIATESFDTTPVSFDANEIARIFSISKKVDRMSIPAFEAAIVDELADSVLECLAYSLVNGSGDGEGEGIEHGVEWVAGENLLEVAEADFGWRDITRLVSMLKRGYAKSARFAMNYSTLYNLVATLHSDIDEPLYLRDVNDPATGRLLGFPVVLDDYLEDNSIVFGAWDYLAYNLPEGVAIERSETSGFRTGTVDFRGMAIADSRVILPEAFVMLRVE